MHLHNKIIHINSILSNDKKCNEDLIALVEDIIPPTFLNQGMHFAAACLM